MSNRVYRPPQGVIFGMRAMLCCALLSAVSISAQSAREKLDLDAIARIREAALNHSEVAETAGYLSDVVGPRLTGSPNFKLAQLYVRDRLAGWGLAAAHLEPWGPFGRGWSLEALAVNQLAPGFTPLIAYPKAWSPGTDGIVRGEAVLLDVGSTADIERYVGRLKGRIVLLSPARAVDPLFEPQQTRQSDASLLALANAPAAAQSRPFQFTPEQLAVQSLDYAKWQLLQSEGAAVVLTPGYRDGGAVYVTAATVPQPPGVPFARRQRAFDLTAPPILPQLAVAVEQYNRIARLLARGIPVQLEVNLAVRFFEADPMSANVLAEIPGGDLKDEIVMLGASLDSWHAGTGASDNAAGAATAMEAVRIIQALGLKPRRTIRVGLWSAEEQGTLGSHAYVAAHFGRRVPKPPDDEQGVVIETKSEYSKLAGYFNLDYGSGRIRGIYLQGNEGARPIFRDWMAPFADLGVATLSAASIGATDHIAFDEIGLPAFQFIRDYFEGSAGKDPAHTNMDTLDHVLFDDLKQSAAVAAAFVYTLAMRDAPLPRRPLPSK